MAKKRKSKSSTSANDDINGASASSESVRRKAPEEEHAQKKKHNHDSDSDDDSSSDDDSLVLEGVLMRNPDASSSSSDDEYNEDISSEEDEEGGMHQKKKAKKQSNAKSDSASSSKSISNNTKKQNTQQQQQSKKKKKKQPTNEPETIQVEFLFCDMNERYFHGIKTLLHRHGIHAPHSSQLSDLIIENEMVGTVLSTDDTTPSVAAASAGGNNKKKAIKSNNTSTANAQSEESNVFGFASIINVTTNHSSPAIQSLKKICLKHCPTQHKSEMETVLSGRTKRPAGFFIQERMVNVPLEITYILHEQLVLDMDYAINNADDEIERKSLDFGAFVRLAPCYKSNEQGGSGVIYKYFDDEVFATNSEFLYNFEIPKLSYENNDGGEEDDNKMWCSVIVMTKTGHRNAMKELKKMIHG